MKILCIEAEWGRDDLPAFIIVSGNVHIEIEVLRPKLKRWHWWDDSRVYHGVFARTAMIPVLSIHAEWWRPDKVPLTDRLPEWVGTAKTVLLPQLREQLLEAAMTPNYFRTILTKFTVAEDLFGPMDSLTSTCRHCGRRIVKENGRWVDPEATGDDSVWRETCDQHDTFVAEHEPTLEETN